MNVKRGVYFLANDDIIEMAIAFLNSFRCYNPDIPLCLIPYSTDFEILSSLQEKYNYTIFANKKTLEVCDNISIKFPSYNFGGFRKIAMWEGPFDEFIFIDVDTVVLSNLDFAFNYLTDFDFVTSHSSIPSIRKWVWRDSIYDTNLLSEEQISYAASTGFIISHKKALPLKLILEKIEDALQLQPHMEIVCGEQPFLNYMFVTSGKYTSLYSIVIKKYDKNIPLEQWAGEKHGLTFRGKIYFPMKNNHPVLMIHWAGKYQKTKFDLFIFKILCSIGIKVKKPKIRFFMPYKRFWKYYRYMKINKIKKLQKKIYKYTS